MKQLPEWNSLETVKVIVSLLTPLAILFFTLQTNRQLNDNKNRQENNKRIFDKRQAIYDQIGPMLNDIYTYHMYLGQWKELSPADLINSKRRLDKIMYTNRPYFDSASILLNLYNEFMDNAFLTFSGMGKNAKLRTEKDLHKYYIDTNIIKWDEKWNDDFTDEDKRPEIHKLYYQFLQQVSHELNLSVDTTVIPRMPNLKPSIVKR